MSIPKGRFKSAWVHAQFVQSPLCTQKKLIYADSEDADQKADLRLLVLMSQLVYAPLVLSFIFLFNFMNHHVFKPI